MKILNLKCCEKFDQSLDMIFLFDKKKKGVRNNFFQELFGDCKSQVFEESNFQNEIRNLNLLERCVELFNSRLKQNELANKTIESKLSEFFLNSKILNKLCKCNVIFST